MSILYHDILAQVAVRISALTGSLAANLQTTYATRPLTSALFKSAVFPFDACIDAILNAEEKLANTIASTASHPWRSYLADETGLLAIGDRLPTTSQDGDPIIGVWSAVLNSADLRAMTSQPVQVIERNFANPGGFFTQPVYYYRILGDRIMHTRAFVFIDCCVYNRLTQKTAALANQDALLPDALDEAYVVGALSYLVRDNQFVEQAIGFRKYFDDTLAMIASGGTTVQPFSPPAASVNVVEG